MQTSPDSAPNDGELPASLRFLKWLVIVLMITMIGGVITITTVLVTRMPDGNAAPRLPDSLPLPDGATASAVTYGQGWVLVVTSDGRVLVYDGLGQMTREIAVPELALKNGLAP